MQRRTLSLQQRHRRSVRRSLARCSSAAIRLVEAPRDAPERRRRGGGAWSRPSPRVCERVDGRRDVRDHFLLDRTQGADDVEHDRAIYGRASHRLTVGTSEDVSERELRSQSRSACASPPRERPCRRDPTSAAGPCSSRSLARIPFRKRRSGPTPSDQIDPPFRSTSMNMNAPGMKNHGTPSSPR